MATKLELPDDLLEEIRLRASQDGRNLDDMVTDLLRQALAGSGSPVGVPVDGAMLDARRRVAERFISGEWGTQLTGFEATRAADRECANTRDRKWRG